MKILESRKIISKIGNFSLELRIREHDAGYYISNGRASTKFAQASEVQQEVQDEFKRFVRIATALEM